MRRLSYMCTLDGGLDELEGNAGPFSYRYGRHSAPESFARVATRLILAWVLGLSAAAIPRVALAGEPTSQDRSTARALSVEGYDALQAGDYALAADRFKRADALVHAPTLLVDLGRAYVGLGRLVEAHEAFQQVLREGVAPDSPESWQRALVVARMEDAAVEPRLAWLTIRVEGADAARVLLDDQEVSQASLGARRAVDPGRLTVVAEAEGFLPARDTIELGEGKTGEIDLVLVRDPNYEPPAKPHEGERVIVVEGGSPRQRVPAYMAYGVGGAGMLLGGVSTVLMLLTRSDLEEQCAAQQCPPEAADDLSKYRTYGTLAAVGFGVGLAGLGVGTYFLLSETPGSAKARSYPVTAYVSPGYVRVSGRF